MKNQNKTFYFFFFFFAYSKSNLENHMFQIAKEKLSFWKQTSSSFSFFYVTDRMWV